jgi:hypothetical protein
LEIEGPGPPKGQHAEWEPYPIGWKFWLWDYYGPKRQGIPAPRLPPDTGVFSPPRKAASSLAPTGGLPETNNYTQLELDELEASLVAGDQGLMEISA